MEPAQSQSPCMPITFIRSEWHCKNIWCLGAVEIQRLQNRLDMICKDSGPRVACHLSCKPSRLRCYRGLIRPTQTNCLLLIAVLNLMTSCVGWIYHSWFSPTRLLPWRRLLSAMLAPKQTRSIERSQWESKLKSVLCIVLFCGSRGDGNNFLNFIEYL